VYEILDCGLNPFEDHLAALACSRNCPCSPNGNNTIVAEPQHLDAAAAPETKNETDFGSDS
jgi:hypothetical protein